MTTKRSRPGMVSGTGTGLRRRELLLATSLSFVATLMPTGVPTAAAAGPRYYLRLRGVEIAAGAIVGGEPSATAPAKPAEAPGSAPADGGSVAAEPAGRRSPSEAVVAMASENLTAELRKRPEVVLELDGVAADAPPARIKEELQRRGLRGYEVTLRLLKVERTLRPAPAGRRFRLLEQSVRVALVGTLYPGDPQLALGGDGESAVQIEVGAQISENQERDALTEAVKDAVSQAVTQGLRKLSAGPVKPPKDPPRRRPPAKPPAK